MTSKVKQRVKRMMARIRTTTPVPCSRDVVAEAFQNLGLIEHSMSPEAVLTNFGQVLRAVWTETLAVLEHYENETYATGIPLALAQEYPEKFGEAEEQAAQHGFAAGVVRLFFSSLPAHQGMFPLRGSKPQDARRQGF